MKRVPLLPALAIAALLAWLVGYPLLRTLLEALGGSKGWTLHWFGELIHRPDEWLALWRSLWISAASVLLAALVGLGITFVGLAYHHHRRWHEHQRYLEEHEDKRTTRSRSK